MVRLLEISSPDLKSSLIQACDLTAEALRADKVDVFLYEPLRESLVALGTSNQPLSAEERKLGLDILALANGGRAVQVFRTGQTFVSGHLENDSEELLGIRESLGVRSTVGAPLEVGGRRRGLLLIASRTAEFFDDEDVRLTESVSRWIGIVAHRAELIERIARDAEAQGRRAAAEELVTVIAHEFRNLLSPIASRLHLLHARAVRDGRDPDARDAAAGADSVHRLGRMVSSILDVARIDRGLFELETRPIDLTALAQDVAASMGRPDQPVEVQASGEVVVPADAERIRQCVENLVSNASHHSPPGAPVTLRVEVVRRGSESVARLEVRDRGPGVAPELLPRLFERFAAGKPTGLGIGLYLAREIARAHGGDLRAESAPGEGARFVLTLPAP